MIAWGAEKRKLQKTFTNVHYIEDRFSHAKLHNSLIKAKNIVIMGNTFEAYQTAQGVREYLDSINHYETQIMLMTTRHGEIRKSLGKGLENYIKSLLKNQRISFQPNVNIVDLKGDSELEAIYFNKEGMYGEDHTGETVDYFVNPDLVICENGIGQPV